MGENNKKATQAELPVPEMAPPPVTKYKTDILVVGTGFAGIPAAVTAKKSGAKVMLVDKGCCSFSGPSPWAQSYQYFRESFGDDAEMQMKYTMIGGEYIANLDWYKLFLEESYASYQELCQWGINKHYPAASECDPDFYSAGQQEEYHKQYMKYDRRLAWRKLVRDNDIPVVNRTMITNIVTKNGHTVGAMGFDVPSGAVITIHANAVLLCTGAGNYRNSGYPLSGVTYDGEYMCYQLGASVTGREFEKPQGTNSVYPAANWNTYSWGYLENLHVTAGCSQFATPLLQKLKKSMGDIGLVGKLPLLKDGIKPLKTGFEPGFTPAGNAKESFDPENDVRTEGNKADAMPKRDILGGCVGTGNWKNTGVFCGLEDFDGYTGIPGLYVAGDAYASMMYGAAYTPGQGGSLPVSQIQGEHSAKAALAYCKDREAAFIDDELKSKIAAEILEPLNRKTGLDPHWARDVLHACMSPFWVSLTKDEASLKAALVYVEHLRDEVVPILIARNSHDLRLVHEVRHQVLDAEMKLRASLERKESRGTHYRKDYPFRDDKNFLCYIICRRGQDGKMLTEKVPVKPEWTGDLQEDYAKRYPIRFPGEAAAIGLEEEPPAAPSWKKE